MSVQWSTIRQSLVGLVLEVFVMFPLILPRTDPWKLSLSLSALSTPKKSALVLAGRRQRSAGARRLRRRAWGPRLGIRRSRQDEEENADLCDGGGPQGSASSLTAQKQALQPAYRMLQQRPLLSSTSACDIR